MMFKTVLGTAFIVILVASADVQAGDDFSVAGEMKVPASVSVAGEVPSSVDVTGIEPPARRVFGGISGISPPAASVGINGIEKPQAARYALVKNPASSFGLFSFLDWLLALFGIA